VYTSYLGWESRTNSLSENIAESFSHNISHVVTYAWPYVGRKLQTMFAAAARSSNLQHTVAARVTNALVLTRGFAAPKKKASNPLGEEIVSDSIPAEQKKKLKGWFEQIVSTGMKAPEDTRTPEQKAEDEKFLEAIRPLQSQYEQRLRQLEERKIRVKIAAVNALPEVLRREALKEDPTPWPISLVVPADYPASKETLYAHWQIPLETAQKSETALDNKKKN